MEIKEEEIKFTAKHNGYH